MGLQQGRVTALARAGVRGVDRLWLRNLYGFGIAPHMVFYLKTDVETLIGRVLAAERRERGAVDAELAGIFAEILLHHVHREGIVPGGGVALLYAAKALDGLTPENNDQKVGIDIVKRALQSPVRQVAENAGTEGSVVVGKLLDSNDLNRGYDAQSGEYVDMVKAGIIDPTKVVRLALQNAASVAGLLVTTEAMVAEKPEKKSMPAMPHGGGMDGMDDF